jgi:SNF2 family DNA or RNA helicase
MVRRLKDEVLTELPPKRRQIIEVDPEDASAKTAVANERAATAKQSEHIDHLKTAVELAKAAENDEQYAAAVEMLRAGLQVQFEEMARVRHDTAVAKAPYVVTHIGDVLGGTEKVVVFAHHHDVIDRLMAGLSEYHPVALTGKTPQADRQGIVDTFQTDESCRVFIGSITAAGVGITLTAASTVVFAELDWVPGNISQCEDRCHRIGQRDSVLVQHIVLSDSIDVTMAKTIVDKQEVIHQAMNETYSEPETPVTPGEQGATANTHRAQITQESLLVKPEHSEVVLDALKTLSAYCDGARKLDGAGFNRIDARIGHELAGNSSLSPRQTILGLKIAWKYHRQLGSLSDALETVRDEIKQACHGC